MGGGGVGGGGIWQKLHGGFALDGPFLISLSARLIGVVICQVSMRSGPCYVQTCSEPLLPFLDPEHRFSESLSCLQLPCSSPLFRSRDAGSFLFPRFEM